MPTLVLQTSRLPLILIWTMYFNGLMIALVAPFNCHKGQRVADRAKKMCEPCSKGYYQPEASDSLYCLVCTKCGKGSKEESPCTHTANRVCRCLKGFSPREEDSATCKCEIGFEIRMDECRACEDGYFSSSIDSECKAWTKCPENKVPVFGSKTSDVVCHDHLPPTTMTPGLKTETTSLRTTLHTSPPPETSTPTVLPHQKTSANNMLAAVHDRNHHVTGGLIVGVVVGLLILIAVAIRCRAKEDPACKCPIKETQQEKFHLIDTA